MRNCLNHVSMPCQQPIQPAEVYDHSVVLFNIIGSANCNNSDGREQQVRAPLQSGRWMVWRL